nr:3D domain protein [uncultured bacterium]
MRKLKRLTAAILVASTLFFNAITGKESESNGEDEEEPPEAYAEPLPPNLTPEGIAKMGEYKAEQAKVRRKSNAQQTQVAQKQPEKLRQPSRGSKYVGQAQTYEATAYTAYCEGCSGITKTGVDLRESIYHEGRRVIAVDPRRIPLGSVVHVTLPDGTTFEATAQDIGGAIKGAIIDVAHETTQEAYVFGRQTVEVRMLKRGK